jgi:hypothetical protein
MRTESTSPKPQAACTSSRWFFGFGIGTFVLVIYVGGSWQWLYSSASSITTRFIYATALLVLLLVGVVHLVAAFLLRNRVLISRADGDSTRLAGFNGAPTVEIGGIVRKMRSNPELVGASGKAFVSRIQGRWYFVVAEAANAICEYTNSA